jgi:hypothetical protein
VTVNYRVYLPNTKVLDKEIIGEAGEEHLTDDVDV